MAIVSKASQMKPEDVQKLKLGLYKIYWKSGGHSLASVGQLHDGAKWMAPCNWSSQAKDGVVTTDWSGVEKVEQINHEMVLIEVDIPL